MFFKSKALPNTILVSNKFSEKSLKDLNFEKILLRLSVEETNTLLNYEQKLHNLFDFVMKGNFKINAMDHYSVFLRADNFSGLAFNSTTREQLPIKEFKNKQVFAAVHSLFNKTKSYQTSLYWLENNNEIKLVLPTFHQEDDARKLIHEAFYKSALRNSLNELVFHSNQVIFFEKNGKKFAPIVLSKEDFLARVVKSTGKAEFNTYFKEFLKAADEIKKLNLVVAAETFATWKELSTSSENYQIIGKIQKDDVNTTVYSVKSEAFSAQQLATLTSLEIQK